MLVRTLQIEIDRRGDLRPARSNALERDAGVGPHIHHIRDLVVDFRVLTQDLCRIEREPGRDAAALHSRRDLFDQLLGARM